MATGKGNHLSGKLIRHLFNATAYSPPANVDFALYTVVPTGAGGGTEVAGGSGYVRQVYVNTGWTVEAAQVVANTVEVAWTQATGNWGTVVAAAMFEGSTNNLMYWGNLTVNRVVNDGDSVRFAIGGVTVGET